MSPLGRMGICTMGALLELQMGHLMLGGVVVVREGALGVALPRWPAGWRSGAWRCLPAGWRWDVCLNGGWKWGVGPSLLAEEGDSAG